MKKPNIERLEMLLKHMESEPLSVDRFDFSTFRSYDRSYDQDDSESVCGTAGCMGGELPIVFPESWEIQRNCVFRTGDIDYGLSPMDQIKRFFNLTESEAYHLFMPDYQAPELYGGVLLHNHATKEEVTENLRIFIELYKNNSHVTTT